MRKIPVLLPDGTKPKWAYPEHFVNLFEWSGNGDSIQKSLSPSWAVDGRPLYVLNLNNQYRLDWDLAKSKDPANHCVFDALDPVFWAEIERRNGVLVLDSAVESMRPTENIAVGMERGIRRAGVDPTRVAIINCNKKASALFRERYFSGGGSYPKIVDFDTCFWLLVGFNRETDSSAEAIMSRFKRAEAARALMREKKFVSFNGRLRPHRYFVILWLLAAGYLDSGYVSFLGYESKAKKSDWDLLRRDLVSSKYRELDLVLPHFDALAARLPMSIDVSLEASQEGGAYKRKLPWRSQSSKIYDQSWFSVVVDTDFRHLDDLFLTPIAFKSFMNVSPFVYFGNCGALERMRQLGLRTFSPYIDETYDSIENPVDRMSAALNQVSRLCQMTAEQLRDLYNTLWPVLEHNYWHMYRWAPKDSGLALREGLLGAIYR